MLVFLLSKGVNMRTLISRRTVTIDVVLLMGMVTLFSMQVSAEPPAPPPPDGYIFEQYGLNYDEASLISYLQNGVPKELADKDGQKMSNYRRWTTFYPEIVRLLAKAKSEAAVPILCDMLAALPPALAADLDTSVELLESREYKRVYFQAGCAETLGEIGMDAAVPALSGFAQRLLPDLKQNIKTENNSAYQVAFRLTCTSLGLLGEEEGVALLMAALPDAPDDCLWAIIPLQVLTGITFSPTYGPEYGHPKRVERALCKKWLAWWKENRATYQVDRDAIRERNSRFRPRPPMTTIRDYIHEVPFRELTPCTGAPTERGKAAAAWLEQNGPKRLDDLAALMNDPDETIGVRREAMAWYAKFGGRKARKELMPYVQNKVSFDAEDAYLQSEMGRAAFEIIKASDTKKAHKLLRDSLKDSGRIPNLWGFNLLRQYDSEEADVLAEKLLLSSDCKISAATAKQLVGNIMGWHLVIRNFEHLCPYAQIQAVESLSSNISAAKSILSKALKIEDQELRKAAENIVQKYKLEGLLDEQ